MVAAGTCAPAAGTATATVCPTAMTAAPTTPTAADQASPSLASIAPHKAGGRHAPCLQSTLQESRWLNYLKLQKESGFQKMKAHQNEIRMKKLEARKNAKNLEKEQRKIRYE